MRLEWLQDLLAIIDAGSLSGAADRRFISQSAFTRRVRGIELTLGAELCDRSSRPVRLLPHVAEQQSRMRRIAMELTALKSALADSAGVLHNRVSFACQHTIATTLSPGLMRELTRDGRINVRVRTGDREACLMLLLSSAVDFALVFGALDDDIGRRHGVLLEESLGTERMIPVMASAFEAQIREAMGRRILPIVSYPDDVYFGRLFERVFLADVAARYQVKRTAETALTLAALHYTLEGIGVGWLPRSIAARDLEQGRLIDLSTTLPSHELRTTIVRLRVEQSDLAEQVWRQIADEYRRTAAPSVGDVNTRVPDDGGLA